MAKWGAIGRNMQAKFMSSSSSISTSARNPTDDKGIRNKYLLHNDAAYVEEALYPSIRSYMSSTCGAIHFFDIRNIKWWRNSRSGDKKGINGPTRNLASSQIACVNFLLPLVDILDALTTILNTVDNDIVDIVDIRYDGLASPVEFEWIGIDKSIEGGGSRGANATSADALIVGRTSKGTNRAYLFEWKYVEEYRSYTDKSKASGKAGATRLKRYTPLYNSATSSFSGVVPIQV